MSDKAAPPRGLLSKVVKFVRHPTTPWSQLDASDDRSAEVLSKEALQEIAARRKRNDAIRAREFDTLRRLRNKEPVSQLDPLSQPSFLQSSLESVGSERERTLKKIDEIEAQMSMHWWRGKDSAQGLGKGRSSGQAAGRGSGWARSSQSPPTRREPRGPESVISRSQLQRSGRTTLLSPAEAPPGVGMAQPSGLFVAPTVQAAALMGADSRQPVGFAGSMGFQVEVAELTHDPELEEAAIRFANGEDAVAERALLDAVAPGGPRHGHQDSWLVLFDFYRATARQTPFEIAAIDFARQFGCSAPQWVSLPDQAERAASAAASVLAAEAPTGLHLAPDWVSPAILDAGALRDLTRQLPAQSRLRLDWSALKRIEPTAAPVLHAVLVSVGPQPNLQLEFMGAARLLDLLVEATPAGRGDLDPVWWQLRMEVYRLMGRDTDFEMTALDYCVTYEVSPPSWEPVRCSFTAVDSPSLMGFATGDPSGRGEGPDSVLRRPDLLVTGPVSSQFPDQPEPPAIRLIGEITGDELTATLARIDARTGPAERLSIDCSQLLRVDFDAAGGLLNWVLAHQAAQRRVEFVEVHRLVALLLSVIGITEHTAVYTRRD